MFQTTIRSLLMGAFYADLANHFLYLFREGGLILYIGQSSDVFARVSAHVGTNPFDASSMMGRLIRANAPQSDGWAVEFLTKEDCQRRIPMSERGCYAGMTLYDVACLNKIDHSIDTLERSMIRQFRPCLNIAYNPSPTVLPSHYRLPTNEVPNGMICTPHPERVTYQVSYLAYDWKAQRNVKYTVTMNARYARECRAHTIRLLGYLPEQFHARRLDEPSGEISFFARFSPSVESRRSEKSIHLPSVEQLWWCDDGDDTHTTPFCPNERGENQEDNDEWLQNGH